MPCDSHARNRAQTSSVGAFDGAAVVVVVFAEVGRDRDTRIRCTCCAAVVVVVDAIVVGGAVVDDDDDVVVDGVVVEVDVAVADSAGTITVASCTRGNAIER